jgi:hypothetical protein
MEQCIRVDTPLRRGAPHVTSARMPQHRILSQSPGIPSPISPSLTWAFSPCVFLSFLRVNVCSADGYSAAGDHHLRSLLCHQHQEDRALRPHWADRSRGTKGDADDTLDLCPTIHLLPIMKRLILAIRHVAHFFRVDQLVCAVGQALPSAKSFLVALALTHITIQCRR